MKLKIILDKLDEFYFNIINFFPLYLYFLDCVLLDNLQHIQWDFLVLYIINLIYLIIK